MAVALGRPVLGQVQLDAQVRRVEDPFGRIRELKADQNLLTWGSPALVQGMLDEGLVDELVLLYSPIVLGEGKRLFGEGARHDLEVTETTRLGGGMLALRLAAAR